MTDTQATPRPWVVEADIRPEFDRPYAQWVKSADNRHTIAACVYGRSEEQQVANARLIVTAVNAYDAMREALNESRRLLAVLAVEKPSFAEAIAETKAQIVAALAAAEGKGE